MVKRLLTVGSVVMVMAALAVVTFVATDAQAQMNKPKMETLSGRLIDLTCAAKGKALMNKWGNALNDDHMTPAGQKAGCARMCLKGGQPAALFDTKKQDIKAVFACNPQATLADYAAEDVEVQGFWAGGKAVKTFVPTKIRKAGETSWKAVDCATMHT